MVTPFFRMLKPAVPFESSPQVPCSARQQILLVPPSARTQNQTTSPKSLPSLLPIIGNIAPTGPPTGLPALSPAQNLSSTPQPHRMEHARTSVQSPQGFTSSTQDKAEVSQEASLTSRISRPVSLLLIHARPATMAGSVLEHL